MKGAGKDCTSLFDKKHAWVNWQTFLASCYIGPLLPDPDDSAQPGEEEKKE